MTVVGKAHKVVNAKRHLAAKCVTSFANLFKSLSWRQQIAKEAELFKKMASKSSFLNYHNVKHHCSYYYYPLKKPL